MLTNYIVKYYTPNAQDGAFNLLELNANNYAYYFMLYIDGELTQTEKNIVSLYLKNNPNLQTAFTTLQQSVLQIETVSFLKNNLYKETIITAQNVASYYLLNIDNELTVEEKEKLNTYLLANPTAEQNLQLYTKAKLQKEEHSFNKTLLQKTNNPLFNNQNNIAEILTLYIDGETSVAQNIIIESIIQNDATVQNELALLQKTKLATTNVIIFANKKALYKKEKIDRPIIPMWLRYAAAGCLAAIFALVVVNKNTKKINEPNTIVKNNAPINEKPLTIIYNTTDTIINNKQINTVAPFVNNTIATNTNKSTNNNKTVKNNNNVKNALNENKLVTKTNEPRIINNNVGKNKALLNIVDNQGLEKETANNSLAYGNAINLKTDKETTIGTLSTTLLVSNTNTAFAHNNIEASNDVSILNIPTNKLDKKGNGKRLKSKLSSFLQNKIESISNTTIAVGKYEITLAQPQ